MQVPGVLDRVTYEQSGSSLVADAASGATTLYVEWHAEFSSQGIPGKLEVGGVTYTYSAINSDLNSITLTTGLTAAASTDDPVHSLTPAGEERGELKAYVRTTQDADAVPYDVNTPGAAFITVATPSGTDLVVDDSTRQVVGRPDIPTGADLTGAINVPDPVTVAQTPPASAPTVKVVGQPTSLLVVVTDTAPQPALMQYYISSTDGFTPGPTNAYGPPTRDRIIAIPTLADGTKLAPGTTYYVVVKPYNAGGDGPLSTQAQGQLDTSAISSLFATFAAFGFVMTGRILVGQSYWDANEGLVFLNADGSRTVLPVNGVDPAVINAYVIAKALTVVNGMQVYGMSQFFGTSVWSNGITDPTTAPTFTRAWPSKATNLGDSTGLGAARHGLTQATASGSYLTATAFFGGALTAIDKTTGNATDVSGGLSGVGTWGPSYNPTGGVTRIGVNFYALGQDSSRSNRWFVYVFDATYAKTAEWEYTAQANSTYQPTIGNDGTNVIIARAASDGASFKVNTFTTAGVATATGVTGTTLLTTTTGVGADLGGVYVGSADFGAARVVLTQAGGSVKVFNTSGVRQTGNEFLSAGNSSINGLYWDGTVFHHLDNNGTLWDYTANAADATIQGGYSWYDADVSSGSTVHETRAESTRTSYVLKARSGFTITTPPAPEAGVTDPTKRDKANLVNVYVSSTVGGTLRLQAMLALNVTAATIYTINTGSAAAPTTNGFASLTTAIGSQQSAATSGGNPLWFFDGSGAYRLNGAPLDEVAVGTSLTAIANTTVTYQVRNGFVYLYAVGTAAYAVGTTTLVAANVIPAAYRPTVSFVQPVALASAFTGYLVVNSNGSVQLINQSGASRTGLNQALVSFPKP